MLIERLRATLRCWQQPSLVRALRSWQHAHRILRRKNGAWAIALEANESIDVRAGWRALRKRVNRVQRRHARVRRVAMLACCLSLLRWRRMLLSRRADARSLQLAARAHAAGLPLRSTWHVWLRVTLQLARLAHLARRADASARLVGLQQQARAVRALSSWCEASYVQRDLTARARAAWLGRTLSHGLPTILARWCERAKDVELRERRVRVAKATRLVHPFWVRSATACALVRWRAAAASRQRACRPHEREHAQLARRLVWKRELRRWLAWYVSSLERRAAGRVGSLHHRVVTAAVLLRAMRRASADALWWARLTRMAGGARRRRCVSAWRAVCEARRLVGAATACSCLRALHRACTTWTVVAMAERENRGLIARGIVARRRVHARALQVAIWAWGAVWRAESSQHTHASRLGHATKRRRMQASWMRWRQDSRSGALYRVVARAADRRARDVALAAWREAAASQGALRLAHRAVSGASQRRALESSLWRWRALYHLEHRRRRAPFRCALRAARAEAASPAPASLLSSPRAHEDTRNPRGHMAPKGARGTPHEDTWHQRGHVAPKRTRGTPHEDTPTDNESRKAALEEALATQVRDVWNSARQRARARALVRERWQRWQRYLPSHSKHAAALVTARARGRTLQRAKRRWKHWTVRMWQLSCSLLEAAEHAKRAWWYTWWQRTRECRARRGMWARAPLRAAWLQRWRRASKAHTALAASEESRWNTTRLHLLIGAIRCLATRALFIGAMRARLDTQARAFDSWVSRVHRRRGVATWRNAAAACKGVRVGSERAPAVLEPLRRRSALRRLMRRWRARAVLRLLSELEYERRLGHSGGERAAFGQWQCAVGHRHYRRALEAIGASAARHVSARQALHQLSRAAARRRLQGIGRAALKHELEVLWRCHTGALEAAFEVSAAQWPTAPR